MGLIMLPGRVRVRNSDLDTATSTTDQLRPSALELRPPASAWRSAGPGLSCMCNSPPTRSVNYYDIELQRPSPRAHSSEFI